MSTPRWFAFFVVFSFGSALGAIAQERAAPFDAPVVVADLHQRFSATLDLDGDGWQDVVSWWWPDGSGNFVSVSGFLNDQHGKLSLVWTTAFDTGLNHNGAVFVGRCDFDHDGQDDFYAINNYGNGRLVAFKSNGAAPPVVVPAYGLSSQSPLLGCVFADFNADGITDRALLTVDKLRIWTYSNTGGNLTATETTTLALPGNADAMVSLDANRDATPDLAINIGTRTLIVPVVNGVGQIAQNILHGIDHMPMLTAGDIDADGDEDVVIFGMSDYAVLRCTGPAQYTAERIQTGGPATRLIDVDGDGLLDGVCCGGGGTHDGPGQPENRDLSVFRISLNRDGRFLPAFETSWLGSDHLAGAVDLDHDGDLDFVAGRCVYYGRGPLKGPITPTISTTAKGPRGCVDFDGDGDPDLRVGVPSTMRNLGDGSVDTFAPVCTPPPGMTYHGPGFPGDFDGDGHPDLVISMYQGSTFVSMRLLLNNGGGGFIDAGDAATPGLDFNILPTYEDDLPDRSFVADADGDGDLDLFTFGIWAAPHGTRLWLNDGSGHFTFAHDFGPIIVSYVGDLNGDGYPDILGADPGAFRSWFATGPGVFPNFGNTFTFDMLALNLDRPAVADFDGDGLADVLLCVRYGSGGPSHVYEFHNNGNSTFTGLPEATGGVLGVSGVPVLTLIADVDGDGLGDLIVGPVYKEENCIEVALRKADNSGFEAPIRQVVFRNDEQQAYPTTAFCTDVDGDGDLDLVADRIVHNGTATPPHGGARRQTGHGIVGAGGMTPTLGATGPFLIGSSIHLLVTGAPPRATGRLTIGVASQSEPPFPSGPSGGFHTIPYAIPLTTLPFTTVGTPGIDGSGAWDLLLHVPAAVVGQTHRYRATLMDPGASSGQSATNDLFLTFGP